MSTTTINLHALIASRYTDPSHYKSYLNAPFAVNGWLVGTDGLGMLATPAAPADATVIPAPDFIVSLIDDDPSGEVVSLADLRTWAGDPEPIEEDEDLGEQECHACGETHICIQTVRLPLRHGWLFGQSLDRRRLANLLESLPGDVVRVHSQRGEKPFRFFGDGWRALLMPTRQLEPLQAVDVRFPAEAND
jgi:hypothetical protein